ncbi:V-ATPase subunit G 3 [Intoshia linei]|uniref:V-ATPase subunit G 3 n=1 Tax=Intoshia linei TaxID=1819745 RepID=A0A177BBR8_9BILA|nr:V-ATPase subunit G 3 [Intoshia linei]
MKISPLIDTSASKNKRRLTKIHNIKRNNYMNTICTNSLKNDKCALDHCHSTCESKGNHSVESEPISHKISETSAKWKISTSNLADFRESNVNFHIRARYENVNLKFESNDNDAENVESVEPKSVSLTNLLDAGVIEPDKKCHVPTTNITDRDLPGKLTPPQSLNHKIEENYQFSNETTKIKNKMQFNPTKNRFSHCTIYNFDDLIVHPYNLNIDLNMYACFKTNRRTVYSDNVFKKIYFFDDYDLYNQNFDISRRNNYSSTPCPATKNILSTRKLNLNDVLHITEKKDMLGSLYSRAKPIVLLQTSNGVVFSTQSLSMEKSHEILFNVNPHITSEIAKKHDISLFNDTIDLFSRSRKNLSYNVISIIEKNSGKLFKISDDNFINKNLKSRSIYRRYQEFFRLKMQKKSKNIRTISDIIANRENLVKKISYTNRLKISHIGLCITLNLEEDISDIMDINAIVRFSEKDARPNSKHDGKPSIHCWTDSKRISLKTSRQSILENLKKQYMMWCPRSRYRSCYNHSVESFKNMCVSLRRDAGSSRVLFHYRDFNLPTKLVNTDCIYVFEKTVRKFNPIRCEDLMIWLGSPTVFIIDSINAENILDKLKSLIEPSDSDEECDYEDYNSKKSKIRFKSTDDSDSLQSVKIHSPIEPPLNVPIRGVLKNGTKSSFSTNPNSSNSDTSKPKKKVSFALELMQMCRSDYFIIASNRKNQFFIEKNDLPTDMFTSCMTTPYKTLLLLYTSLYPDVFRSLVKSLNGRFEIPGGINKRNTMLGDLHWIFTCICDSLLWSHVDIDTYRLLIKQDIGTGNFWRNFLLSQWLLKSYKITPISYPALPDLWQHPLWELWKVCLNEAIFQLPGILDEKAKYQPSSFYLNQLTNFRLWINRTSFIDNGYLMNPVTPPTMPSLVLVLLGQMYRLEALQLICRYLESCIDALQVLLVLGISPFIIRLVKTEDETLKPYILYIWSHILFTKEIALGDLLSNSIHLYFLEILSDNPCSSLKTISAYCLCALLHHYEGYSTLLCDKKVFFIIAGLLDDSGSILNRWLINLVSYLWKNNENARWIGVRNCIDEYLCHHTSSKYPYIRAACISALGTFIYSTKWHTSHATYVDKRVLMHILNSVLDINPLVRKEVIAAISGFIILRMSDFVNLVLQIKTRVVDFNSRVLTIPSPAFSRKSASLKCSRTNSFKKRFNIKRQNSVNEKDDDIIMFDRTSKYSDMNSLFDIWRNFELLCNDPCMEVRRVAKRLMAKIRKKVDYMIKETYTTKIFNIDNQLSIGDNTIPCKFVQRIMNPSDSSLCVSMYNDVRSVLATEFNSSLNSESKEPIKNKPKREDYIFSNYFETEQVMFMDNLFNLILNEIGSVKTKVTTAEIDTGELLKAEFFIKTAENIKLQESKLSQKRKVKNIKKKTNVPVAPALRKFSIVPTIKEETRVEPIIFEPLENILCTPFETYKAQSEPITSDNSDKLNFDTLEKRSKTKTCLEKIDKSDKEKADQSETVPNVKRYYTVKDFKVKNVVINYETSEDNTIIESRSVTFENAKIVYDNVPFNVRDGYRIYDSRLENFKSKFEEFAVDEREDVITYTQDIVNNILNNQFRDCEPGTRQMRCMFDKIDRCDACKIIEKENLEIKMEKIDVDEILQLSVVDDFKDKRDCLDIIYSKKLPDEKLKFVMFNNDSNNVAVASSDNIYFINYETDEMYEFNTDLSRKFVNMEFINDAQRDYLMTINDSAIVNVYKDVFNCKDDFSEVACWNSPFDLAQSINRRKICLLAYQPINAKMYFCSTNSFIYNCDLVRETWNELICVDSYISHVTSICTSPFNSNVLLVGSAKGTIQCFDSRQANHVFSKNYDHECCEIKFPYFSSNHFFAAYDDNKVMMWDFRLSWSPIVYDFQINNFDSGKIDNFDVHTNYQLMSRNYKNSEKIYITTFNGENLPTSMPEPDENLRKGSISSKFKNIKNSFYNKFTRSIDPISIVSLKFHPSLSINILVTRDLIMVKKEEDTSYLCEEGIYKSKNFNHEINEIQRLLEAEKKANKLINEARERKSLKLQKAKKEAMHELDLYKQQRQSVFKKMEDNLEVEREKLKVELDATLLTRVDEIKIALEKSGPNIVDKLIDTIFNINPKIHIDEFTLNDKLGAFYV